MPEQSRKASHLAGLAPQKSAPNVLVVEDEVLIRLDIADELRVSGFCVIEAASAEEALDLLASGSQVDVIFSDYRLHGALDGWALRNAVREEYPDLPFILTSAQVPPAEARAEGIPFVSKPYEPSRVVALISKTTNEDTT